MGLRFPSEWRSNRMSSAIRASKSSPTCWTFIGSPGTTSLAVFALQWDKDGKVLEAFTPDFYLPEFDLYVELTTMKQAQRNQEEPEDPAAARDLSAREHPGFLSERRAGFGDEVRIAGAAGAMNERMSG